MLAEDHLRRVLHLFVRFLHQVVFSLSHNHSYAGDHNKFEKACQGYKIYLQVGKTADVLIQSWRIELKTSLHPIRNERWSWRVSEGAPVAFRHKYKEPLFLGEAPDHLRGRKSAIDPQLSLKPHPVAACGWLDTAVRARSVIAGIGLGRWLSLAMQLFFDPVFVRLAH